MLAQCLLWALPLLAIVQTRDFAIPTVWPLFSPDMAILIHHVKTDPRLRIKFNTINPMWNLPRDQPWEFSDQPHQSPLPDRWPRPVEPEIHWPRIIEPEHRQRGGPPATVCLSTGHAHPARPILTNLIETFQGMITTPLTIPEKHALIEADDYHLVPRCHLNQMRDSSQYAYYISASSSSSLPRRQRRQLPQDEESSDGD